VLDRLNCLDDEPLRLGASPPRGLTAGLRRPSV